MYSVRQADRQEYGQIDEDEEQRYRSNEVNILLLTYLLSFRSSWSSWSLEKERNPSQTLMHQFTMFIFFFIQVQLQFAFDGRFYPKQCT